MDKKNIVLLAVAVVALGVGFLGGYKYRDTKTPRFQAGMDQNRQFGGRNQAGNGGTGMMRQGFRPVMGEIIEIKDKTVTVKTENGGSKVVILAESTTVNKSTKVERSELKVGTKISVFGQEGTDGTLNANMIQLINADGSTTPPTPTGK